VSAYIFYFIFFKIASACAPCVGRSTFDDRTKRWPGLIVFLALICVVPVSSVNLPRDDLLVRLNYGLVASKLRKVCVVDGYWKHTMHIKLASRSASPRFMITAPNSTTCDLQCMTVKALQAASKNLTDSMRQSVAKMIDNIYTLTGRVHPSSVNKRPRRTNWVGYAINYVTGLATEEELTDFQEVIRRVKASSDLSAAGLELTRNEMATYAKLSNERMDSLHALLNMEVSSIEKIQNYVTSLSGAMNIETSALIYLMNELKEYTQVHDNVAAFQTGIHELVNGFLSPNIVDVESLRALLITTAHRLRMQGKQLCYESPSDVYASRTFSFIRHGNDLAIQLTLPFSSNGKMDFYRTRQFPLRVPGKQGFITELTEFPKYLLMDVSKGLIGEVDELPSSNIIDSTDIYWHKPYSKSCVYEIMQDNVNLVHEVCEFSVRRALMAPSYTKVAPATYVLSNITDVITVCNGVQREKNDCELCLLTLQCGCVLSSARWNLTADITSCSDSTLASASLDHAVNLALIQKLYETSNLSFSASALFDYDKLPQLAPIQLPILASNVTRLFAADTQQTFSLNKIAQNLANDSIVVHSPSDAFFYDFFTRKFAADSFFHFNAGNWISWAIVVLLTAFFGALVMGYRMHCKLQILMSLAASGNFGRASAQNLSRILHLQTNRPPIDQSIDALDFIVRFMNDLRYLDIFILIALCIIVLLAVIAIFFTLRHALAKQSHLYLEVKQGTRAMHVKFMNLSDGMRFYSIKLPTSPITLSLKYYGFMALLTITMTQFRVKNTLTNITLHVPTAVWLSPWTAFKLNQIILSSDYTVQFLLVHSHEFNYLSNLERSS
jgi:hypothetical protein